jgi:glycine hydroxymethyltransferase
MTITPSFSSSAPTARFPEETQSAANMNALRDGLAQSDPEIAAALLREEERQRRGLELIPSENYAFPEVLALLGSVFTNKYSEGYPGRRYYGGRKIPTLWKNWHGSGPRRFSARNTPMCSPYPARP